MPLPNIYTREDERVLATFDFFDVADGTGFVKYWLSASSSPATDYHLGTEQVYSTVIDTKGTSTTSSTKIIDLDFDLTSFNLPRTIRGTALVQSTLKVSSAAGTTINTVFMQTRIRKWDGTNETEIAVARSQNVVQINGTIGHEMILFPITIPKTHFRKGETLRVTVELWGIKGVADGASFSWFGHDPQNRDSKQLGLDPSTDDPVSINKTHIFIPYDIDI